MDIFGYKLVTGEDVIAEELYNDGNVVKVKTPVTLVMFPSETCSAKAMFVPFPVTGEAKVGNECEIMREHYIIRYKPSDEYVQRYQQSFGSGIVVSKKELVLG